MSEAITRSAIERKESRGGHFREDYPDKAAEFGDDQHRDAEGGDGSMEVRPHADSADACRVEAGHRGTTEVSADGTTSATFKVWRKRQAGSATIPSTIVPGMVVLDAIHQIQATQAPDLAVRWNCKAGKCGSCSAEVNGNPRLMCMTRLSTPADSTSRSPSSRCRRFRSSRIS